MLATLTKLCIPSQRFICVFVLDCAHNSLVSSRYIGKQQVQPAKDDSVHSVLMRLPGRLRNRASQNHCFFKDTSSLNPCTDKESFSESCPISIAVQSWHWRIAAIKCSQTACETHKRTHRGDCISRSQEIVTCRQL